MKKPIIPLASIFFLLLFVSSKCKKETSEPQLPPETTIGAMTFGCKVNGRIFIPKDGDGAPGLYAQYVNLGTGIDGGYYLNIAAADREGKLMESMNIGTDSLWLVQDSIYSFKNFVKGFPIGEYRYFPNGSMIRFQVLQHNHGELFITKHDQNRRILSGQFWFDGTNSDGDKIEIREGRFDIVY